MSETHIASAFDRDLEGVQALLMRMGGLVEVAIRDSCTALEARDEDLAGRVRGEDERIDALERQINEEVARIIALRAPTASDLRTLIAVMRISGNLERCGDFAKNIAKRVTAVRTLSPVGGTLVSIRRMGRGVEAMLSDTLDAFLRRDAQAAELVRERDSEIDDTYNALFRELLTHMMEDPRNITYCMHLHFIAKNLERIGDHATSVADNVIYLVTGARPAEKRSTRDATPWFAEGSER
jgi:phosphate transport system protein